MRKETSKRTRVMPLNTCERSQVVTCCSLFCATPQQQSLHHDHYHLETVASKTVKTFKYKTCKISKHKQKGKQIITPIQRRTTQSII